MEDIILIGGGGHCKSVIDAIISKGDYNIVAIVDTAENIGKKICEYEINYTDKDLKLLFDKGYQNACITLGSTGKFHVRRKLYQQAKDIGFQFPIICDKSAAVSKFTEIGEGTFIGKNCVVNTDAVIGKMAIINTGSIVEHESSIGEFSFISIGALVAGNAKVGQETYLGAGAVVIQGISVGENCIIGAGSIVVRHIEPHKKAYGVPCREVEPW